MDFLNNLDIFQNVINIDNSVFETNKARQADYSFDTNKARQAEYTFNANKAAQADYTFDANKAKQAEYTFDANKASQANYTYNNKKDSFASYTITHADSDPSKNWRTIMADQVLGDIKQRIFDIVHPTGEVYVRFPHMDEPATLYNKNGITSTWELLNYDGAFFRANGTNADPFITYPYPLSPQSDCFQGHWHETPVSGATDADASYDDWRKARVNFNNKMPIQITGNPMSDGAHGDPRTGNETRPKNYTIQIWRKTS